MSEEILVNIEKKLDSILRLLAFNFIQEKNKTESIISLGALGMDRNVISEIVGVPPKNVSVRLSEAKRQKKIKRSD